MHSLSLSLSRQSPEFSNLGYEKKIAAKGEESRSPWQPFTMQKKVLLRKKVEEKTCAVLIFVTRLTTCYFSSIYSLKKNKIYLLLLAPHSKGPRTIRFSYYKRDYVERDEGWRLCKFYSPGRMLHKLWGGGGLPSEEVGSLHRSRLHSVEIVFRMEQHVSFSSFSIYKNVFFTIKSMRESMQSRMSIWKCLSLNCYRSSPWA